MRAPPLALGPQNRRNTFTESVRQWARAPRPTAVTSDLQHLPGDFLHELRREHARDVERVAERIQLDDVGAVKGSRKGLNDVDDVARGESCRFAMCDARRERRIERVEVDREICRLVKRWPASAVPRRHVDYLDTEPLDLPELFVVHRANADLRQRRGETVFEDSRERARV